MNYRLLLVALIYPHIDITSVSIKRLKFSAMGPMVIQCFSGAQLLKLMMS